MKGSQNHAPSSSDLRYQQLSQLIKRYELGAITHQQFEQIKTEILLGESVPRSLQPSRIELIVATYSKLGEIQASMENLLERSASPRHGIIDGALILKSSTGAVRIRSIAGLSRARDTGVSPVFISLCSLLFPVGAFQIDSSGVGWDEALDYMERRGVKDVELRDFGGGLPRSSQSISILYWSFGADEIAGAFRGFDHFARRILTDVVADALTDLLSNSTSAER